MLRRLDPDLEAGPLTQRLKFLVALRPGIIAPGYAARQAAALDQVLDGRLLLNIVTGGNPGELGQDGLHLDPDQRIPRLAISGYDAMALIEGQRSIRGSDNDRILPYNHRFTGTAFQRACQDLGIEDLPFQDLRHERASRLFEAGLEIQQVALVTGHKDWTMRRRYTHLKPEALHVIAANHAA